MPWIVQAEKDGTLYKVEIESPFWEHVHVSHRGRFGKIDEGNGEMINSYVDAQVQQVYARSVSNHSQTAPDISAAFFGKPDDHYNLDDYTRFSKMEEVFREYVAPVAVNRIAGKPVLRVYKPDEHETYNRDPLVLLDGYPVMDITKLFEFDPLKVHSIDVINRRYARAGSVFDGIVSLNTYSHNLNGYKVDSAAKIIRNMNIAAAKRFVAPAYEDSTQRYSRLPDFRNQLYWNANVNTNEITFYTSDVEGTFIAVVQTINENGETGSNQIRFEVEKVKGER